MNQEAKIDYLIDYLLAESPDSIQHVTQDQTDTLKEKIELFRGLCNVRSPQSVTDKFLSVQDAFLTEWNEESPRTGIQDLEEMAPQLYVWQGDITTLQVDAIVNAANSAFLGCMLANHGCIDNIIHTRAGVQLRLACDAIIQAQGRKEPSGKAKITKGYNLPSEYVIHTVGPFIDKRGVSPIKEHLLASCYRASLALADEYELTSIAFCCVSTGEFNFPNRHAAEIAIQTVREYLDEKKSNLRVIFNVFKDEDLEIYEELLGVEE